jgi:hypothetical protein
MTVDFDLDLISGAQNRSWRLPESWSDSAPVSMPSTAQVLAAYEFPLQTFL